MHELCNHWICPVALKCDSLALKCCWFFSAVLVLNVSNYLWRSAPLNDTHILRLISAKLIHVSPFSVFEWHRRCAQRSHRHILLYLNILEPVGWQDSCQKARPSLWLNIRWLFHPTLSIDYTIVPVQLTEFILSWYGRGQGGGGISASYFW